MSVRHLTDEEVSLLTRAIDEAESTDGLTCGELARARSALARDPLRAGSALSHEHAEVIKAVLRGVPLAGTPTALADGIDELCDAADAATETPEQLSASTIGEGLRRLGVDTDCDACMLRFWVGREATHAPQCRTPDRAKVEADVVVRICCWLWGRDNAGADGIITALQRGDWKPK